MEMVLSLLLSPLVAAAGIFFSKKNLDYWIVSVLMIVLWSLAAFVYFQDGVIEMSAVAWGMKVLAAADVLLLLYFLYQGKWDRRVLYLSVVQLILYGWVEAILPEGSETLIKVDELSRFMFLIIDGVGPIIVLFALSYMRAEETTPFKRKLFGAYLLIFLSVMNALVIADSLILFFFLFEMTTLASFLLIGFRDDIQSRKNALQALWMNQVGGSAILIGILVAVYGFGAVTFSILLESGGENVLLAAALLCMAALVKGASLPFDRWLLGAMIAPTPVSAMLHSATMVKIAPFMILKLSPLLGANVLGETVSLIGALVFVSASVLALSRDVFKEILGYSTIALLGLMMSLAAIGTEESRNLTMALMVFHALSKALLFLAAGTLEKEHHAKTVTQMAGMAERSPAAVGFILFGFVSLTLPPFGLFMGKLFAIASIASLMSIEPFYLIVLLSLVVGSALLVLLYFKVASTLLAASSDVVSMQKKKMATGYVIPLSVLVIISIAGAVDYLMKGPDISSAVLIIPLGVVMVVWALWRWTRGFDRTDVYFCGERGLFADAPMYYSLPLEAERMLQRIFAILFVLVALAGVMA